MGATAIAIPYVLFVWWFSTGSVLLLVGLSLRHGVLLKAGAAVLFVAALAGVEISSRDTTAAGAYCVFTCAILLWGAVEISLLAGWVTGPRPQSCPRDCTMADRVWFALQATAYHELALIATAALVFAVTAGAPNQLGWWTFAALLVLRQSAKINLFLGVRTLNDELMPAQVDFLRSYFAHKQINALFPLSVTAATAAAAWLAIAAGNAEAGFEALSYALLGTLVALGALEHWFMVLPMPVVDLWRWSMRTQKSADVLADVLAEPGVRPVLAVIPGGAAAAERPVAKSAAAKSAAAKSAAVKSAAFLARQRLEDQFRQAYRESKAAGAAEQEQNLTFNRTAEGRAP